LASSWKPTLRFSWQAVRELWSFGLNIFIEGMVSNLDQRIDQLVIGKVFSADQLGLYTRAKSLNLFVARFSSRSLSAVAFPVLAEVQDQRQRWVRIAAQIIHFASFASMALSGLMYVVAEPLILLLLTEKWRGAVEIFEILCWSAPFVPLSAAALSPVKAVGHSGMLLRISVVKSLLRYAGMAVGLMFGLKGFLISLVITGILGLVINALAVLRSIGMSWVDHLRCIAPYLMIALCAATAWSAGLESLFPPNLWIRLFCGIGVYFTLYAGLNLVFRTHGSAQLVRGLVDGLNVMRGISAEKR